MNVLKPSDLIRSEFSQNDDVKRFAVFGKPIAHSLSPLMQNKALEEIAKMDSSYENSKYYAFEVDPNDLEQVLQLFWDKNFYGINLTIPHKEVVMNIIDDFDETAFVAKSCNTLLRTKNGWKGFNTDGFGVSASVEYAFDRDFKNADVVIIGAGGAGKGAAATILRAQCKSLLVANRNQERLANFAKIFELGDFYLDTAPIEGVEDKIKDGSIIINATSIGLNENDSPIIDFSKIGKSCVFLDMPYSRKGETVSVLSAKKNSIPAENGLSMLAWQGAKSLSIWTGQPLFGNLMLKTLKTALYGYK